MRGTGKFSVRFLMIGTQKCLSSRLLPSLRGNLNSVNGVLLKFLFSIPLLSKKNKKFRAKSIKNKWNEIAKELFIRSGKKYFRTAKQCREYWINHLDPVPVRRNWTALEDFNLIEAVKELGKKWSKVSKKLGGKRTEHMVKNRFKSLYHFESKRRNISIDASMKEEDVLEQLSMKLKFNMEEE